MSGGVEKCNYGRSLPSTSCCNQKDIYCIYFRTRGSALALMNVDHPQDLRDFCSLILWDSLVRTLKRLLEEWIILTLNSVNVYRPIVGQIPYLSMHDSL